MNEFDALLTRLEYEVNNLEIKQKGSFFQSIRATQDSEAHGVAKKLSIELLNHRNEYVTNMTIDAVEFKTKCQTSLNKDKVKSTLAKHHSSTLTDLIKDILFWVTNVASFGILPLVVRLSTGEARLGLFKPTPTEATQTVEKFEINIAKIA